MRKHKAPRRCRSTGWRNRHNGVAGPERQGVGAARQKVDEAADEFDCISDSTAMVFASGKSGFVAVIIPFELR